MTYPVKATVYEPMYEYNDKKYIRLTVPDKVKDFILALHVNKSNVILFPDKLDDPLEGNVLKVKVPFRYRRVMCNVDGDTPVQSLKRGIPSKLKSNLTVFGTLTNIADTRGY